jgi:hypothetical protein
LTYRRPYLGYVGHKNTGNEQNDEAA